MELLHFVGSIFVLLFLSIAMNIDTRRPMSTKIKYKYRVKDDSIFRKVFPIKDKKYYPCNYFKIIPVFVFLLLAILGLILLLINILSNGFITALVPPNVLIIVTLSIWLTAILYFITITIWWGIVEYNEMKFTREEKEELKRLRKNRKESESRKKCD